MKRDVFHAVADPTRRAILVLIAVQAMTPNALAVRFETTRQAVSKHIKILTECELLTRQKEGRKIYYHFNPQKINEIDIWLDQFKKLLENRFIQLDQVLTNLNSNKDEN
jgi:DNA-binding transcriptional ArsR family regulator